MRKALLFVSLVIISSCARPQYTCTYITTRVDAPIEFSGFTPQDVDTLFITYYRPDSTFSNVISKDTVISPSVYQSDIYLFRASNMSDFAVINDSKDLKIQLAKAGNVFYLHAVYPPPDTMIDREEACLPRSFISLPKVYANGKAVQYSTVYTNQLFLAP
ncbi:MAG: hypothetical protein P4L41_00375 [Flavipsychrobacter sp.]|nr:hypothetical protein [Flavipsychrobacter sp.]